MRDDPRSVNSESILILLATLVFRVHYLPFRAQRYYSKVNFLYHLGVGGSGCGLDVGRVGGPEDGFISGCVHVLVRG